MEEPPVPFRFTTLGPRQIRLLKLLPGDGDESLKCEISIISLDENPRYEAVSYVWGSPTPPAFINCSTGFIQITTNLEAGLHRIRDKKTPRILWADQICINKKSVTERSEQVGIMGDIFNRAERVIMWLGHDEVSIQSAPVAARFLAHLADRPCDTFFKLTPPTDENLREHNLPDLPAIEWRALNALFSRPFFTRVWIVQEVQLAREREVLWGAIVISWEHLTGAVDFLIRNEMLYDHIGTALDPGPLFQVDRLMRPLDKWVMAAPMIYVCEATDLRDKLFGVQGLLPTSKVPLELRPDYSKSLCDVLTSLARHLIVNDGFDALIFVICLAGTLINHIAALEVENWPSWVPQWKRVSLMPIFIRLSKVSSSDDHTALQIAWPTSNPQSLQIYGVHVDKIAYITERHPSVQVENEKQVISYIVTAWELCQKHADAVENSENSENSPLRCFLSTLVIGTYRSTGDKTASHDVLCREFAAFWALCHLLELMQTPMTAAELEKRLQLGFAALFAYAHDRVTYSRIGDEDFVLAVRDFIERDHPIPVSLTPQRAIIESILREKYPASDEFRQVMRLLNPFIAAQTNDEHFYSRCQPSVNHRCFFISENGRTGLAPGNAEVGDPVVICFGVKSPIILRMRDDGCYTLLGECYLEGIMEGEYVKGLKNNGGLKDATVVFEIV